MPPLLERVRRRLRVTASLDSAQTSRVARYMAARVAEVRWGPGAADELAVMSDPEIAAAVDVLSRPTPAGTLR